MSKRVLVVEDQEDKMLARPVDLVWPRRGLFARRTAGVGDVGRVHADTATLPES